MFNVVIVEDEKPSLYLMKRMIEKNPYLKVVGEFTNSWEALGEIPLLEPEIVFLDVEMPGMDGMELAEKIHEQNDAIQIVFVTAHRDYAVDAFKVNAVDYILKPVMEKAIHAAAEKIVRRYSTMNRAAAKVKKHSIFCLGSFEVFEKNSDTPIKWTTSKAEEIFAYLMFCKGEYVSKWKLCEMLWPDWEPEKAEHSLHNAIYLLKSTLNRAGIENAIESKQGSYRGNVQSFHCDAFALEDFAWENKKVNAGNINEFERMVSTFKGNLFEGKDYLWSEDWNERLNRQYAAMISDISRYYMEAREYEKTEEKLRKLIKLNPLNEQAHELLLEVYYAMEDRIKLSMHYKQLKKILKEELDLEPSTRAKKLYRQVNAKRKMER